MGTLAEGLKKIADTKTKLKEVLLARGIEVTDFESYPEKLDEAILLPLMNLGYDLETAKLYMQDLDWDDIKDLFKASKALEAFETGYDGGSIGIVNTQLKYMPYFETAGLSLLRGMCWNNNELLTIPKFDLSNITNGQGIFGKLFKIKRLPKFNTPKLTNAAYLCYQNFEMEEVPDYFMDTSNCTVINEAFELCKKLTRLPMLDTSNCTNFYWTFATLYDSTPTEYVQMLPYDLGKATNLTRTFAHTMWKDIEKAKWPTTDKQVTEAYYVFHSCSFYGTDDIPKFNYGAISGTALGLFTGCKSLVNVTELSLPYADNCEQLFQSCPNLETVKKLSVGTASKVSVSFKDCPKLKAIGIIDTPGVNEFVYLVNGDSNLVSVNSIDVTSGTNFYDTFNGCTALRHINFVGFGGTNKFPTTFNINQSPNLFLKDDVLKDTVANLGEEFKSSISDDVPLQRLWIDSFTDRVANGWSNIKINLHATAKARLTSEEIAEFSAKGYTIA